MRTIFVVLLVAFLLYGNYGAGDYIFALDYYSSKVMGMDLFMLYPLFSNLLFLVLLSLFVFSDEILWSIMFVKRRKKPKSYTETIISRE